MQTPSPKVSPQPSSRGRSQWIDLLRGLAVVGMVWTHCANTFLRTDLQATEIYQTMSYYHGLVAPTFFWLVGLMRGLTSAKATAIKKPAWPTARRLLMILGIGYLMHMPWGQLAAGDFGAETWRILFQSDVLQCLAISGLLLLALERTGAAALWLALIVGFAVIFLTDVFAQTHTGWAFLDGYLNRRSGSLFPLFPWVAFAMAGFVCGRFTISGWTALIGAALAYGIPWVPGEHTVLTFFLERLGWVLLLAGGVQLAWTWWERGNHSTAGFRWVLLAGRQSLTGYVAHLVMLYALPVGFSGALAQLIGPTLSPAGVVLMFVVILAATIAVCQWMEARSARAKH